MSSTSGSPAQQRAQEISVEMGRKDWKTKKVPCSDMPTPHSQCLPSSNPKLRPCSSVQHIIPDHSSTFSKLQDSFLAGNGYNTVQKQKRSSLTGAGKENGSLSKSPNGHPLKHGSSAFKGQGTGICITSSKGSLGNSKKVLTDAVSGADPFQALITKAQQELERCASWNKEEQEAEEQQKKERVVEEDEESMACTVRETREVCEKQGTKSAPDNALLKELEKWKEFGYLLAESYDQLKKNFSKGLAESTRDKQIIKALKEQVGKLKDLLKHANKENESLRNELANEENIRERFIENKGKLENVLEECRVAKREKDKLMKQVSALEKEKEIYGNEQTLNSKLVQQLNDKIKKLKSELSERRGVQNGRSEDNKTAFYKKLSQSRLEQCSSLAEQLICLRSDLDRSHAEHVKFQRQHNRSIDGSTNSPLSVSRRSDFDSNRSSDCPKPLSIQPRPTPAGDRSFSVERKGGAGAGEFRSGERAPRIPLPRSSSSKECVNRINGGTRKHQA